MTDSSDRLLYRRKRVSTACDVCRAMKAKCDGKKPLCGRCEGYGYVCDYSKTRRSNKYPTQDAKARQSVERGGRKDDTLRKAFETFESALQNLRDRLPPSDQLQVDNSLIQFKAEVEAAFFDGRKTTSNASPFTFGTPSSRSEGSHGQLDRYLGEVSDIRFFNLVQQILRGPPYISQGDETLDSYEQREPASRWYQVSSNMNLELPDSDVAQEYIEVFFTTIHVAYPFIPRSTFMLEYSKLREIGSVDRMNKSWVALLYIILAIGNYYSSCPETESPPHTDHEKYFQIAMYLSYSEPMLASLNHVSFLLAECFYLLAVCRTDRCWTELGLAVRIAQSIGLHVDSDRSNDHMYFGPLEMEKRRRVWHCVFVLDRLVALQLGRPPAIHDEDCLFALPSRVDDRSIDWENDVQLSVPTVGEPSLGDYFLSMIEFSKIVGRVLRNVYHPKQQQRQRLIAEELQRAKVLNQHLLAWKLALPRSLRFDVSHTFERCAVLKKQRNMLAVKFFHLRALINRPFLCLPVLRSSEQWSLAFLSDEEKLQLTQCEQLCISAAQETARLLHNIKSEKELVHDFPWWQMISCLVCASSILLVANAFGENEWNGGSISLETMSVENAIQLNDDAETCLRVFEALSARSIGASIARQMLRRLQDRGVKQRQRLFGRADDGPSTMTMSATVQENPQGGSENYIRVLEDENTFDNQIWPPEIVDVMNWSTQILDAFPDTSPAPS